MPTLKSIKPFPNHYLFAVLGDPPRSVAIYLKMLLLQTQVVQQLQLLSFREEKGQPKVFPTAHGHLCACRERSRALGERWVGTGRPGHPTFLFACVCAEDSQFYETWENFCNVGGVKT